jgi:hypothetical protein
MSMNIQIQDTGSSVATLVDDEAMRHIALFGCVKGMDPFALHMLKKSPHPVLRFRRNWIRRTALEQHLEAERNQKKIIQKRSNGKAANYAGEIDQHLFDEMRHYNKAPFAEYRKQVKQEAPQFFDAR